MRPPWETDADNRLMRRRNLHTMPWLCLLPLMFLCGCLGRPSNPAATRPATDISPAQATAGYWLDQPGVISVTAMNYDALWNAAEQAARDDLFVIDRHDYREGVLTTNPVTSRQFFEFWRDDALTPYDVARSSLQTIRRSIRFTFLRDSGGRWTVTPKVLVEQYSTVGRRVIYADTYQSFTDPGGQYGSIESDQGVNLPTQYWFAIGRDHVMEKKLAQQIQRLLK